MCVPAHFDDNDSRLQKRVLNFSPVSSHRGNDIGKSLEMCLLEWGINNVLTITLDNASSSREFGRIKIVKQRSPILS